MYVTKLLFALKVIEVLIRSEEGLSRDMVKHLNSIEEQILENLAWREDSVLWDALQASEDEVPRCEEVCCPANNSYLTQKNYSDTYIIFI